MKLYAWQPQGHGEQSFFVMAESESQAKQSVEKKIKSLIESEDYSDYDFTGWGTDYYQLSVVDSETVVINDNS
jgi:hypothetical protein